MINLDAIAGHGPPRIELAGDRPALAGRDARRRRPRGASLEQTGARAARSPGVLAQLIDLGFPFTLYEQGPFVARGIPAVTLTTAGERPPAAFGDSAGRARRGTGSAQLGRAAQELARLARPGPRAGAGDDELRLVRRPHRPRLGDRARADRAAAAVPRRGRRPLRPLPPAPDRARARPPRSAPQPARLLALRRDRFHVFSASSAPGRAAPPRPPEPGSCLGRRLAGARRCSRCSSSRSPAGWSRGDRLVPAARGPAPRSSSRATTVALLGARDRRAARRRRRTRSRCSSSSRRCTPGSGCRRLRTARLPVARSLFLRRARRAALLVLSLALRFGLGLDAPWYLLELVAVGYVQTPPVVIALAGAACAAQLAAVAAGRYAPYPAPAERPARGPSASSCAGRARAPRTAAVAEERRRAAAGSATERR